MPGSRYVIAIDQGTTNTKSVLLDRTGKVRHRSSRPVHISFPRAGWAEQDANEIWNTAREVLKECFDQCQANEVAGIGISNQRETVAMWQRHDGAPVAPCVSWQCQRGADICRRLKSSSRAEATVLAKTGLRLDPMFSASKLAWLLECDPQRRVRAEAGELCAGTIDSWLLWNLSKGHIHGTEASNASRTQLCDIRSAAWDEELLGMFGVPKSVLPVIYSSNAVFGETAGGNGIPAGVPICGILGDSHAALFAHAAFSPGVVKATYGTGSSLMSPVASVRTDQHISNTIAWSLNRQTQHALEGNIFVTGAAVQWVGKLLQLQNPAQEITELAMRTPDSEGVHFVPALAGLGAPHWDASARGVISGLTLASTSAHLARATLDSIAFQVRDVLEAMETAGGIEISELLADGGAAENDLLMQIQTDIIGRPVVRSASRDLSAQGAAWMAGLSSGVWSSLDELKQIPQEVTRFEPKLSASLREEKYARWKEAVARTLGTSTAADRALV